MKKPLKVPRFRNEAEERRFWAKTDLSKHYGPEDFRRVSFPNLKPTSRPISIRLPEYLLNRIKERANEIHIPYQALIKEYLRAGVSSPSPVYRVHKIRGPKGLLRNRPKRP